MKAGVPKEVPSTTVNMLCGSSLKAVVMGYQAIRSGDASLVVAGGQESMSQVCNEGMYVGRYVGMAMRACWYDYQSPPNISQKWSLS